MHLIDNLFEVVGLHPPIAPGAIEIVFFSIVIANLASKVAYIGILDLQDIRHPDQSLPLHKHLELDLQKIEKLERRTMPEEGVCVPVEANELTEPHGFEWYI
jgi:hypothetical protein